MLSQSQWSLLIFSVSQFCLLCVPLKELFKNIKLVFTLHPLPLPMYTGSTSGGPYTAGTSGLGSGQGERHFHWCQLHGHRRVHWLRPLCSRKFNKSKLSCNHNNTVSLLYYNSVLEFTSSFHTHFNMAKQCTIVFNVSQEYKHNIPFEDSFPGCKEGVRSHARENGPREGQAGGGEGNCTNMARACQGVPYPGCGPL